MTSMNEIISKTVQGTKRQLSKKLSVAILVLTLMITGVVSYTSMVKISEAGPGYPFGGLISWVTFCDCSIDGSIAAVYFPDLTVTSATGGLPLIYSGGTIVYQFGPPLNIGTWMLGTFTQGVGVCLIWVGKFCSVVPTAGTMYMVGTSM